MNIAQDMFDATAKFNTAEARLYKLLTSLYGEQKFGDWRTDYHDCSIEVWGVMPSESARFGLHVAGFDSIWQHPHPQGEPDHAVCGCRRQVRP